MNFTISELRERPEFFDTVADRIWQAWWKRNGVLPDYIQARLRESLASPGVPQAFVAHEGGSFLGTASLIASDLDERSQYTPWVAAVWTEAEARGRGVATALVAHARNEAFRAGRDVVYLCARPAMRAYYLERGWKPIEDGVGPLQLTVFAQRRVA